MLEQAATSSAADPQLAAFSSAVAERRDQLAKMEGRMNDIRDRLFAGFR